MKTGRASWYKKLKRRIRKLKRQIWALFLAWKDPETPLLARVVIAIAVAYAISPVDLIPDFIPVLGYMDDLVILPLLIGLAVKLIPPEVRARTRREAWKRLSSGERVQTSAGIAASVVFVCLWIAVIVLLVRFFFFRSR